MEQDAATSIKTNTNMNAPAYQSIKDFILERIRSGTWAEGDQVPSENELAREFQVARMTVNRALRELTAEQVLTRVQGAGTFVARPKYESTLVSIRSISDEIAARGHRHRASVLALGAAVADAALAEEMQIKPGSPIFHSRLLHFENDEPLQLEERWVNPVAAPEYALQDFTQITPNQYLVRVAPLSRVEYRIEAALPEPGTRMQLAMTDGEPSLLLHRRTWTHELVASVVNLWHPGNRYRFTGHF
jgi:GntR family histidine utilization transcriptional repressor